MIAFFLSRGAWLAGGTCGAKAHYDGIKAFSETDLTEDLKSIDVPTLILAGDDDQIVPYKALPCSSSGLHQDVRSA